MDTLSTPQANRVNPTQASILRNNYESELWDDNASVLWEAPTDLTIDTVNTGATLDVCELEVGTQVDCRFHVIAQAHALVAGGAGIWSGMITVDGVDQISSEVMRWPDGLSSNVVWTGTVDLTAGLHTLGIRLGVDAASVNIDFYNKRLIVRRGRKPSTS